MSAHQVGVSARGLCHFPALRTPGSDCCGEHLGGLQWRKVETKGKGKDVEVLGAQAPPGAWGWRLAAPEQAGRVCQQPQTQRWPLGRRASSKLFSVPSSWNRICIFREVVNVNSKTP